MEWSDIVSVSKDADLYTSVVTDALDKRMIILNTEIDDDVIENIIMHIIRWNIEDSNLPKEKRKSIKLLINSPGGDVFDCQSLMDVIGNSTTPIVGIGLGFVASAAYYIFLACHTRVAFKNTTLLQHDGSLYVGNSNGKVKKTMEHFDNMDSRIKDFVLSRTSMDEDFYDEIWEDEFYMYGDDSKQYGVVDMIVGEDISFDELFCE